ncbi:uncharacterized protein TNCT_407551 [Trichonephila clavata]|uniref:Uncharacterized protein n=1 Tax=Trichonephila clavata TaxID=2740835 RepID=A0A8X6L5F3_TRICU|nr:uncharacterized protein TNCT_407551 [Trichonephila clavata]
MEAYIDENGKPLPSFYEASRWNIAKSFGLTVIDCAFFIATGGVATYLAFWKSLYIIAYHIIFGYDISPKSNAITSEETYPEGKDVPSKNGSTTRQDVQKQEDQRSDSSPGSDFQEDEASKSKKRERVAFEETPDESELEKESQL